ALHRAAESEVQIIVDFFLTGAKPRAPQQVLDEMFAMADNLTSGVRIGTLLHGAEAPSSGPMIPLRSRKVPGTFPGKCQAPFRGRRYRTREKPNKSSPLAGSPW